MNITMKTLSALAIATAALAMTVLPGSALPNDRLGDPNITTVFGQPKQPSQPPKLSPVLTKFGNPNTLKVLGTLNQPSGPYHCLVCGLPQPQPGGPKSGDGWKPGHDWHDGWHDRPEIIVEGSPEVITVAAPAQRAPVQSAPARVPAAAPLAAQAAEPCNCLTKQSLPDGSVLFQDICTKESAIAAPATVGAR